MKISKTKINQRMRRKTDSELVETIFLAKKKNLLELARKLSLPRKKQIKINLNEINQEKEENIIVPGKVLSLGSIDKKKKICALKFSEKAKEKILKSGSEAKTLIEILRQGKKIEGKIIG